MLCCVIANKCAQKQQKAICPKAYNLEVLLCKKHHATDVTN